MTLYRDSLIFLIIKFTKGEVASFLFSQEALLFLISSSSFLIFPPPSLLFSQILKEVSPVAFDASEKDVADFGGDVFKGNIFCCCCCEYCGEDIVDFVVGVDHICCCCWD